MKKQSIQGYKIVLLFNFKHKQPEYPMILA